MYYNCDSSGAHYSVLSTQWVTVRNINAARVWTNVHRSLERSLKTSWNHDGESKVIWKTLLRSEPFRHWANESFATGGGFREEVTYRLLGCALRGGTPQVAYSWFGNK